MLERNSLTSRDPPPVVWTEVSMDLIPPAIEGFDEVPAATSPLP